jgi:hypothetical protein
MRESPGHSYDYDEDGNTKVRDPGSSAAATYTWDLVQADDAGVVDQTNKYDDSGNHHYGAISAARGMSLEFSLRGAGLAQILAGTSSHDYLFGPLSDPLDLFPNDDVDWGWPWGSPPFADDPTDQRWITEGYRDLESILSQCRCMLSN